MTISRAAQHLHTAYTGHLQEHQDLAAACRRNYGSDLRQFLAWCEDQRTRAAAGSRGLPMHGT